MSDADLVSCIRTRRAALEAQARRARLEYADLEEEIRQQQHDLALLQRNLDAMHGGLQELDELLRMMQPPVRTDGEEGEPHAHHPATP